MAATSAVLGDTYLVEMIVRYISVRDMTRIQRVCRLWRDTITRSKALKRQMFLEPLPQSTASAQDLLDAAYLPLTKLLQGRSLHRIVNDKALAATSPWSSSHVPCVVLHPRIARSSMNFVSRTTGRLLPKRYQSDPLLKIDYDPRDIDDHVARGELGPGRAFVTQPPIIATEGYFVWQVTCLPIVPPQQQGFVPVVERRGTCSTLKLRREGGIRFYDILQQVLQHIQNWANKLNRVTPLKIDYIKVLMSTVDVVRQGHGIEDVVRPCILSPNDTKGLVEWWSNGHAGRAPPLDSGRLARWLEEATCEASPRDATDQEQATPAADVWRYRDWERRAAFRI